MIAAANEAGALGAKVTGAGGGGCMIALVDSDAQREAGVRAATTARYALNDQFTTWRVEHDQLKATALARANIALAKYWGRATWP